MSGTTSTPAPTSTTNNTATNAAPVQHINTNMYNPHNMHNLYGNVMDSFMNNLVLSKFSDILGGNYSFTPATLGKLLVLTNIALFG